MFCPKEKEAKPDVMYFFQRTKKNKWVLLVLFSFKASDYYKEAMKYGLGPDSEIPAMFTACGKPRYKSYRSRMNGKTSKNMVLQNTTRGVGSSQKLF